MVTTLTSVPTVHTMWEESSTKTCFTSETFLLVAWESNCLRSSSLPLLTLNRIKAFWCCQGREGGDSFPLSLITTHAAHRHRDTQVKHNVSNIKSTLWQVFTAMLRWPLKWPWHALLSFRLFPPKPNPSLPLPSRPLPSLTCTPTANTDALSRVMSQHCSFYVRHKHTCIVKYVSVSCHFTQHTQSHSRWMRLNSTASSRGHKKQTAINIQNASRFGRWHALHTHMAAVNKDASSVRYACCIDRVQ